MQANESAGRVADRMRDIASIDPALGAYNFSNLGEIVNFAEIMAQGGAMVPPFCQGKVPVCAAIVCRAMQWRFDPFALAELAYQPKEGGRVAYEAKVFQAILVNNGITLEFEYSGELAWSDQAATSSKGNQTAAQTASGTRQITAFLRDENGEKVQKYTSPPIANIKPKNSPLWHHDPDQQLAYFASRAWARRYRPDLIMGALSREEVIEPQIKDVTPRGGSRPRSGGFAARIKPPQPEVAEEAGVDTVDATAQDVHSGDSRDGVDDGSDDASGDEAALGTAGPASEGDGDAVEQISPQVDSEPSPLSPEDEARIIGEAQQCALEGGSVEDCPYLELEPEARRIWVETFQGVELD